MRFISNECTPAAKPGIDRDTNVVSANNPDVKLDSERFIPLYPIRTDPEKIFTSGTDYRYSNTGYALLAMIVEKKSGLTFSEFLKENIFSPLEMNNSVAHQEGISNITNRAYGYSQEDDGYNLDDQSLTSAVLGDGGIYTSLNDMFRWDQSLYVDTLIPYEILNEAFTSGELSSGEKTGYGFGWRMDTYLYRNRAHHTGSTRGFRNVFMRFPDQKISILILTNRNSGKPINIAEKIADYLFDA